MTNALPRGAPSLRSIAWAIVAALLLAMVAGAASAHGDAPSSLSQRLRLDQQFRRDVGLRSDATYVLDLAQNREYTVPGSRAEFGALLTPQEQEEMEQWDRLSEAMSVVYRYADKNARLAFGGAFITDQASGGVANIAFTHDGSRHLQNIARQFPYPERLHLVSVDRTLATLEGVHSKVASDIDALEGEGIEVRSVNTDVSGNVIEISVASADSETVADLEAKYGSENIEVHETPSPVTTSRSNNFPPMKSGLQIQNGSLLNYSYRCTSAFSAYDVNFNYYQVTAGHCTEKGSTWYHGNNLLGPHATPDKFYSGSNIDGGLIKLSSQVVASNLVYKTDSTTVSITQQENYNYDSVGDRICMSGVTSGNVCGTVESRSYTASYSDARLNNQRLSSFNSIPGDSGAGIYRDSKAIGIMSGTTSSTSSSAQGIYSHIGYLRPAYDYEYPNLTIVKS